MWYWIGGIGYFIVILLTFIICIKYHFKEYKKDVTLDDISDYITWSIAWPFYLWILLVCKLDEIKDNTIIKYNHKRSLEEEIKLYEELKRKFENITER